MGRIKIKKVKERIIYYLTQYPHLRDNDEKLIATIWKDYITQNYGSTTKMSGYYVLGLLADGSLPNPESIRRSRCKIQETTPQLRGVKYNKRKSNDDDIKGDLNTFDDGDE